MKPSEVRSDLLGEHFELRRLIEAARGVLEASAPAPDALEVALERLAVVLAAHAKHEEEALYELAESRSEQARKPSAVMDEDHVGDHERLVAEVRAACATTDAAARRARVEKALAELDAHMTSEEVVLLGEDMLGDDAP